jgi:RNA polymerase sigma-70 factor (ECF subfamily)
LGISRHGNLLLESGHESYLLECANYQPKGMPVLTFSVASVEDLAIQLQREGVKTGPIETDEWFGKLLAFYDPDGNKYNAVENK